MLHGLIQNWLSPRILFIRKPHIAGTALHISRLSHDLALREETHTYMPIIDLSTEGRKRHQRQIWYNSLQALPTVEEKLYELAIQQRHKLKKYKISPIPPTYNAAQFLRYLTRTHLVHGLPKNLSLMNVEKELGEIKGIFCEELRQYYSLNALEYLLKEEGAGMKLVKNLVSQCYKKLAWKNDYIFSSTIQTKPRIDSFFWYGGFESKQKKTFEENLCFKYQDFPGFVIRIKEPMSPILGMDDPLCATADVPEYHFHPTVMGIPFNRDDWLSSVPGYWPGESSEFPFLLVYPSTQLRNFLQKIDKYDLSKIEDTVGIVSSFGWLNALTTYQGFTPFHDVTYPFVTHTILTNGQDWNFYVYQLNTTAFHQDVDRKDRRNICWSSGKLRLFDTVEDGIVKGINDEVFTVLLKFLLNAPVPQKNLVLKPYLGEDVRTEDDANNMRHLFRRMYSQAPNPQAHKEEIPHWKRIYLMHPEAPPAPFLKRH